MAVNKVEFGDEVIMDITDSTVNEDNLLEGEVAYGPDGEKVEGKAQFGFKAYINGVELKGYLTSTDLGIMWVGTHEDYDTDIDLIPDGTIIYFTDDNGEDFEWEYIGKKPFEELGYEFSVSEDGQLCLSKEIRDNLSDIQENIDYLHNNCLPKESPVANTRIQVNSYRDDDYNIRTIIGNESTYHSIDLTELCNYIEFKLVYLGETAANILYIEMPYIENLCVAVVSNVLKNVDRITLRLTLKTTYTNDVSEISMAYIPFEFFDVVFDEYTDNNKNYKYIFKMINPPSGKIIVSSSTTAFGEREIKNKEVEGYMIISFPDILSSKILLMDKKFGKYFEVTNNEEPVIRIIENGVIETPAFQDNVKVGGQPNLIPSVLMEHITPVARGNLVGRLLASGDYYVLEDGAQYVVSMVAFTTSGTYRGAHIIFVASTFGDKIKTGATTTALGVPKTVSLGAGGTVGYSWTNSTYQYTDKDGKTKYHSMIGIGSCTTAIHLRYNIHKIGSSNDIF